jgi:hypothetical protein
MNIPNPDCADGLVHGLEHSELSRIVHTAPAFGFVPNNKQGPAANHGNFTDHEGPQLHCSNLPIATCAAGGPTEESRRIK